MLFCIKVSRMKCLTRMSQATNACEYLGGIRKNLGGNAEKLAAGLQSKEWHSNQGQMLC